MLPMPPEKPHWAHLFREVIESGLCTGCAGCVIACPYQVLGYDSETSYRPYHIEEHGGPTDCTYGERGCTLCTRACPRFRSWEPEADYQLFGRPREAEETFGVWKKAYLGRTTDPAIAAAGQDGGLVSAILIWALEHDIVDAALVSGVSPSRPLKAQAQVARSRSEVLAAAGSRYTYSANTLAYQPAVDGGAERLALVGMGCQTSVPAIMAARKAGKVARRFTLTIGLMCSKTFDDTIYEALLEAEHGISRTQIAKTNIKGRFQIWCHDGSYHEVPLADCRRYTRSGCLHCPDFAAEHADISTGGIGKFSEWTLAIVRTDRGAELIDSMAADGAIELRPASDDPDGWELLSKLSRSSRRRWPELAAPEPRMGLPTKTASSDRAP
jgi:coenzyme F420 hydrogenase subunit beta